MPNQFLEESFPRGVRLGAKWTEEYAVEIVETASGAEYRRLIHPFPRRRFVVDLTQLTADLTNGVMAMYHRAYGRFGGFRVYCHDDHTTAQDGESAPTMLDSWLDPTSSGIYQLFKSYGRNGPTPDYFYPSRTIYKPIAGTLLVSKNGTQIMSGVTMDTTTGKITISPAPLITDIIKAGCEFELPCRFDSPLDSIAIDPKYRDCGSIELVELITP